MKKYYCLDCSKEISRNGRRCKSCVGKLRFNQGKIITKTRKNIDFNNIKNLYIKEGLSTSKIGKMNNCSGHIILNRLKEKGIQIRNCHERPNWKYKKNYCIECGNEVTGKSKRCSKCACIKNRKTEGTSPDFYKRLAKESLKQECSKCGSREKLCVHHKDKNRKNNKIDNLTLLCRSCHSKEHELKNNLKYNYVKLNAERKKVIQSIKNIPEEEIPIKFKEIIIKCLINECQ